MSERFVATVAVVAGLLAAAAPAHAGTLVGNPGEEPAVIESIGAKCTLLTPPRGDGTNNDVAIETIESVVVFAGGAYDNEVGVRAARLLPEVDDEVLAAVVVTSPARWPGAPGGHPDGEPQVCRATPRRPGRGHERRGAAVDELRVPGRAFPARLWPSRASSLDVRVQRGTQLSETEGFAGVRLGLDTRRRLSAARQNAINNSLNAIVESEATWRVAFADWKGIQGSAVGRGAAPQVAARAAS